MQTSKIIEVNGVFLGAAVMLPQARGWRFVAADQRVGTLDGSVAETIEDTRRIARRLFLAASAVLPAKLEASIGT